MRGLLIVKGERPDRTAEHKKKTMKTNNKNQKSKAQSRPEQLSTGTREKNNLPFISFRERETNRHLPAGYIMASLARWMPHQHKLARVVGGLISIHFEKAPIQRVRQELSEFGFSWNAKHNVWQHYGCVSKGGANV